MSSPEGWEGLTQAVSEAPRAEDIDILYGKVFKSSEGQKVLSHLRSVTIENQLGTLEKMQALVMLEQEWQRSFA